MDWVWKRLAPFVRAAMTIELTGVSEEQLRGILEQEALRRLSWVEAVVFSEEISNEEKVQVIQNRFLEDERDGQ